MTTYNIIKSVYRHFRESYIFAMISTYNISFAFKLYIGNMYLEMLYEKKTEEGVWDKVFT